MRWNSESSTSRRRRPALVKWEYRARRFDGRPLTKYLTLVNVLPEACQRARCYVLRDAAVFMNAAMKRMLNSKSGTAAVASCAEMREA
jgi:hypothetical protein